MKRFLYLDKPSDSSSVRAEAGSGGGEPAATLLSEPAVSIACEVIAVGEIFVGLTAIYKRLEIPECFMGRSQILKHLIIGLKRFKKDRYDTMKNNEEVFFPFKGLDLTE